MKEIEKLLKLGKGYKIIKVEEEIKGTTKKIIYVESTKKKVRCPECNQFTSSIHDRLKPARIKGLKIYEIQSEIVQTKRRFICHKCNKKFTESSTLCEKNKSISNLLV